eukprot:1037877-Pleurochrysis_carterae.AAC.2
MSAATERKDAQVLGYCITQEREGGKDWLWGQEGGSAALIRICAIYCPLLKQKLGCCFAEIVYSVIGTIFAPASQHISVAAADSLSFTHACEVSSGQQGESSRFIGGKDTVPSDGDSRDQPPNCYLI